MCDLYGVQCVCVCYLYGVQCSEQCVCMDCNFHNNSQLDTMFLREKFSFLLITLFGRENLSNL